MTFIVLGTMGWLAFSLIVGGIPATIKSKTPYDWLMWLAIVGGATFVLGQFIFWSVRFYLYFHGDPLPVGIR